MYYSYIMEGIKHRVISDVQGEITKKNIIQNNILETLKSLESKIELLGSKIDRLETFNIKILNELILSLPERLNTIETNINSLPNKMNESYIIL